MTVTLVIFVPVSPGYYLAHPSTEQTSLPPVRASLRGLYGLLLRAYAASASRALPNAAAFCTSGTMALFGVYIALASALCAVAAASSTSSALSRTLLQNVPLFPYCNCLRSDAINPNVIGPAGPAFPEVIGSGSLGFLFTLSNPLPPASAICADADVHKVEFDAVETAQQCVLGARIVGTSARHDVSRNPVMDATNVGNWIIKFVITPPLSQVEIATGTVQLIVSIDFTRNRCGLMGDSFNLKPVPQIPGRTSTDKFFDAALFDKAVDNKCCVIHPIPVAGSCNISAAVSLWRVGLAQEVTDNNMGGSHVKLSIFVDPDFATCGAVGLQNGAEYPVMEIPMEKLEIDQYWADWQQAHRGHVSREATICSVSQGCRITTSLNYPNDAPTFKWTKLNVSWTDGLPTAAFLPTLEFDTINMSIWEVCSGEYDYDYCHWAVYDSSGVQNYCPLGSFGPNVDSPNMGALSNSAQCLA
eukprot:gene11089-18702_t